MAWTWLSSFGALILAEFIPAWGLWGTFIPAVSHWEDLFPAMIPSRNRRRYARREKGDGLRALTPRHYSFLWVHSAGGGLIEGTFIQAVGRFVAFIPGVASSEAFIPAAMVSTGRSS